VRKVNRAGAWRRAAERSGQYARSVPASLRGAIHEPSCRICSAGLHRHDSSPILCWCPVSQSRHDRTGFLWSGAGARNSCGAVASARERSPRSGTWGQYCASSVWRNARSFAKNTFDIGIRFGSAAEEMIANARQEPSAFAGVGSGFHSSPALQVPRCPGWRARPIVGVRGRGAADVRSKSLPFNNRERASAFRSAGARLLVGLQGDIVTVPL
jgi:hypothetical protein